MKYMLLPFAHGIDNAAIEQAVTLATEHTATLIPLSLICVSGQQKAARLDHIQQSKDFLALVQQKAARAGVPVTPIERYTCEEIQTIQQVAVELECTGILLFARQQKGILLSSATIQHLMQQHKRPCFLSSLPARQSMITLPKWNLSKPLRGRIPFPRVQRQRVLLPEQMRSVIEF